MYIIKLFKKKFRSIVSAKKIEYFIDGMRRPREEAIEIVDVILIAGYLQPIRFVDRNYILWCTLINKPIQWVWPHFSFTLSYSKNVMEAVIIRESVNFGIMQFCRSIHRKYQFPTSIYLDTCILYNFMVILKMKLAFNFRRPFFVFLANSGLQIIFCCSSQWLFSAMLIHNHFICPKKERDIYKEIGQSNPLTHI